MKKSGYKANRKPFCIVAKEIQDAQKAAGLRRMEEQRIKNEERVANGLQPYEYKYTYSPIEETHAEESTKTSPVFIPIPWDTNLGECFDDEENLRIAKENLEYAQRENEKTK